MSMVRSSLLTLLLLVFVSGCGDDDPQLVFASATPTPGGGENREPCAAHNPLRNVYFGDLHVHTTLSFDAHAFEVKTTPAQAYRFAKGDQVSLPPLDAEGNGTQSLRLQRPLDFAAVTDHSEFLGEVETCTLPGANGYDSPTCRTYRGADQNAAVVAFGLMLNRPAPFRFPEVCGIDGLGCRELAGTVWQRVQDAAEDAYDRSARCSFTSFVAYEYSAGTGVSTLHRNVIFRNEHVPFPTSYFEQPTPQGLWRQLKATCRDADIGCDVLAIPHNPNESNGKMFFIEYPGTSSIEEQRAQAEMRAVYEPLLEIFQHKGDSECMNGFSGILGAPDELCDFEKRGRVLDRSNDCGDGKGNLGSAVSGCMSRHDFARGILLNGLKESGRLGVNPFEVGFIGSTDTHNGTPGAVEERDFIGHRGTDDATPQRLLGTGALTPGGIYFDPGGLAAVWAEENSRPAIFDSLRRREVYATSGPRITARFFGGWSLPENICSDPAMIRHAYESGQPMGSVLPPAPNGGATPRFVVSALRDPGTSARPGTPLQRLQIIKVWLDGSEPHQQVFEVAGDPNNGASVDIETCTPQGSGADSLCNVWADPDFNPEQHAAYYARVIENPTCRWNVYACQRQPADQRPASCTDPKHPKTIQERAWTSPIWYRPG